MNKEGKQINIKCPVCGNTITAKHRGKEVNGELLHKCSKCKRSWNSNYTTKIITWVEGKLDNTPIKIFKLDLLTGKSRPI